MEADGNSTSRRKNKQSDSGKDQAFLTKAHESWRAFQESCLPGSPASGIKRPWLKYGVELQSRALVEDAAVILWEGGAKTTADLKREIVEGLDQTDSLVVLLDLKRAEHTEDPRWWPTLRVVLQWVDDDPFFAKAIDLWRHARQETILETTMHDLYRDIPRSKDELGVLKERVKFAATVLPRTVNKGLRDKVEVEETHNHLHLHQNLSDEALEDRMSQLIRDARVRAFVAKTGLAGVAGAILEGEVVPMPSGHPAPAALPFRDPEEMQRNLGEDPGPEPPAPGGGAP